MEAAVQAPQIWGLVARAVWRRARRRLRSGPTWAWRYAGRTPDRILIAPPDLRLADPQIAQDIYFGRFPLAGQIVETSGRSPFALSVANPAWIEALQAFRWLRHLRAAQTDLASANARALVADWIAIHGRRIAGIAWEPGITARRIIAWLQHSSVILQNAEFAFYRQFLKSLAFQIRYLRAAAAEMPEGEDRLRARIALAFAALSLPTPASYLRITTRNLAEELDAQILPDGGHRSRNPAVLLELLADLLPLRQTYANQAETPPPALMNAIDRMLPALRFFRHQDGSLARFNGMGVTMNDRVTAVLRHDDTVGRPLLHAPHSGYERLALGNTTVIADTGAPPALDYSGGAHAGCLSFELSANRRMVIVNAGIDALGANDFRPLARATAAHSTATINDASSARFNLSAGVNGLIGTPLVAGPKRVPCRREDDAQSQGFTASHDGYLTRFGLLHERSLRLSEGGEILSGTDHFTGPGGEASAGGSRQATIRFHVHPENAVSIQPDATVTIMARDGERWIFACATASPAIEESIFFAGPAGPRRSHQIVLVLDVATQPSVAWTLSRAVLAEG